tara:strand:- start:48 stop:362 length:315 start_codon:yes stop_codon:yes gene_type:complete
MEVFQNGRFSNGEPVYQIGVPQADGTYEVHVYDLMTKEQAEAKLKEMGGTPAAEVAGEDIAPAIYKSMTKVELEAFMREHGVELDRRKTKAALLKEVDAFFEGK